jgi:hypothetical protein
MGDFSDDEFAEEPKPKVKVKAQGKAPAPEKARAAKSGGAPAAAAAAAVAPADAQGAPGSLGLVASALLAAALAVAIFGRRAQLEGALLYDDKAAVLNSPVTQGEVSLEHVWTRDFWGKDELASAESHKSFRPLVTLTYVANNRLNKLLGHPADLPYYYHVVSVALHALVSALVVPTVTAAFGWRERGLFVPALSAALFAVHPVHVESVQNMVGRAEVLMALFYLVGFLAYARLAIGRDAVVVPAAAPTALTARCVAGIGLTLLCTLGAMLCKETGVTLPVLCAAWDLLVVVGAEPRLFLAYLKPVGGQTAWVARRAPAALARYALLAIGCAALALWRHSLNGGSPAEFSRKQNMAVFHRHPFWRALSVIWGWIVRARERESECRARTPYRTAAPRLEPPRARPQRCERTAPPPPPPGSRAPAHAPTRPGSPARRSTLWWRSCRASSRATGRTPPSRPSTARPTRARPSCARTCARGRPRCARTRGARRASARSSACSGACCPSSSRPTC